MLRQGRLAIAVLVVLAAVSGAGALAAAPSPRRLGFVPRLPAGSSILGQLTGSTPMQVSVALQPRDPAALQQFATAVATPGSSEYRHFITPAQFAQRFGATNGQIGAVEQSLRAHGLAPGRVSANHLSIPVRTTASRLERAFSLALDRILLPGRATAIRNSVAPRLDGDVAGLVQDIVGLSTLSTPRPLLLRPHGVRHLARAHVATGGPQPCATARSTAPSQNSYTADQIASAYGFSGLYRAGDQGQGQTVALFELEPYDPADVAAYQSCYGSHASVSNVIVDGGAGGGPGVGEAALDIEQVIGLAPKANVVVYEGPNSSSAAPGSGYYDTWQALISQDRAQVVSASWGQCEPLVSPGDQQAEGTLFQEAAAQGQTIFSAAGDEGSEDCNGQTGLLGFDGALAVDDPSSQPFVTAVGGTAMNSPGPSPVEQVWNGGTSLGVILGTSAGAGGGGKSTRFGMPSYQSNAPTSLNVRQSSAREIPDVSADADPNTGYLVYYNGSGQGQGPRGWQGFGGTSAAAPVWAAAVALANASSSCDGRLIGFANPALYRVAAKSYGQDFNDITFGENDFTGTNHGLYPAGSGFDMASGLGSPNATPLAAALCGPRVAPKLSGVSLSGVGLSRPELRLTLKAGHGAPDLRSAAIQLPSALRFARKHNRVTVTGSHGKSLGFSLSLKHRILTINLRRATTLANITISYAALTASRRESTAARRGHARKLRIKVTVVDALGVQTTLKASVRPH